MQNISGSDVDKMTSIWLRPLRFLIESGCPLPTIRILSAGLSGLDMLPFGAIAKTRSNRLIFWPVFPSGDSLYKGDGEPAVYDHVTVELSNRRIHSTAFTQTNERRHHSKGWLLHDIPSDGVSFWFNFLVRWSTLYSQDRQVEISIRCPTPDAERRKATLVDHIHKLRIDDIPLPPSGKLGDYLFVAAYIALNDAATISPKSVFLKDIDAYIDGWPDGSQYAIQAKKILLDDLTVVIASGSPIGTLKADLMFKFPIPLSKD